MRHKNKHFWQKLKKKMKDVGVKGFIFGGFVVCKKSNTKNEVIIIAVFPV